ncbi:PHP domain protein [Clostridium sp. DL-VIII]|uniref:PHP domain-containing protein n=1 Tax=Clostridium sp. DL-VIII TaxID=641107 RepID=UPI00023AF586|nr:PHP domain-containing protein [Clostridium sp. DL-VIII]EHI97861.1 PHP domain protein [Clostridium sp. DL-VIII]
MYNKGDFHIHSTFSDGGCTPKEIVMMAKKKNVDIIALTDHNNTDGIDEAILEGYKLGIKVIPGVELSTVYKKSKVHILGYFKDNSYKNELLTKILQNIKKHKISKIKYLFEAHMPFDNRNDKLCVENGIEILKFFGAVVILAHPVLLNRSDFKEIIKMNLDGLEAKYFSNKTEDTEYFLEIAKNKNLLYTAGSDFHNYNKFHRTHGLIGDVYLNRIEIYNFLTGGNLPYF